MDDPQDEKPPIFESLTDPARAREFARKSKKAKIEERRRIVAANLVAGLNYRDIANALDVSVGTVTSDVKAIMAVWKAAQQQDATDWIALELRRLDAALNAIMPAIQEGHLGAIDRLLAIQARRARYIPNLEQPVKVAPTDPSGTQAYAPSIDPAARAQDALRLAELFGIVRPASGAGDDDAAPDSGG